MENKNIRTLTQTDLGVLNPTDTSNNPTEHIEYVPDSTLNTLCKYSPDGSFVHNGKAFVPSLKITYTPHDEAQLTARLCMSESIMRSHEVGEMRNIADCTPQEGVAHASIAYEPRKGRGKKREISAANVRLVNQAIQSPKFSVFAETLDKQKLSLVSDKVDFALVNAELKKCNKELFNKLLSHVYDAMPRAGFSTNVRINKALEEKLRSVLKPHLSEMMTTEVFINSTLLYLLSCLNNQAAMKVYETIHSQSETYYP